MFKKLKSLFKSLIEVASYHSWMCPDCYNETVDCTAFTHVRWESRSKCFMKYIKCDSCSRTTPVYANLKDAIDQWEDQWDIVQSKKSETTESEAKLIGPCKICKHYKEGDTTCKKNKPPASMGCYKDFEVSEDTPFFAKNRTK